MKWRFYITVIFCLCAVQLFSLKFITLDQWQVLYDVIAFLLLVQVFEYNILSSVNKGLFSWEILLLMLIPFFSAIPAYLYHDQPWGQSFLAARPALLLLFYFYIRKRGLAVEKIETLFTYFGIIVAGIYVVQFVIYPTVFFQQLRDQDVFEREGVARVFIQDPSYISFALFFLLNKLLTKARTIDVALFAVCLGGLLLTVTRQVIFASLGFLGLFFVTTLDLRSKRSFTIVLVAALFVLVFLFAGGLAYINKLIALTEEQKVAGNDYIRMQEANFYLFTYMPSGLSYLIGNGIHYGASAYGREIASLETDQNMFRSDIGLIGALNTFGLIYLLPILTIFIKVFRARLYGRRYYKFFFLYMLFTSFTGGNYFALPWTFTLIALLLYNIEVVTKGRSAGQNAAIPRNVTALNP